MIADMAAPLLPQLMQRCAGVLRADVTGPRNRLRDRFVPTSETKSLHGFASDCVWTHLGLKAEITGEN
jgi:hypothetical protein